MCCALRCAEIVDDNYALSDKEEGRLARIAIAPYGVTKRRARQGNRDVIAKTTHVTKSGHGKLIPIPPAAVEFEVEYKIRFDVWLEEVRSGLPPVEKGRASVSLKPTFDESYLPEGMYQLQTERDTLWLQKLAGSWELLAAK